MKVSSFPSFAPQLEEREIVGHGFGQIAHLAEDRDGSCAVALGEAFAIGAEDRG